MSSVLGQDTDSIRLKSLSQTGQSRQAADREEGEGIRKPGGRRRATRRIQLVMCRALLHSTIFMSAVAMLWDDHSG